MGLEHPGNSPLDSHERRISHSLYETIDGSDSSSTPLPNMIGRIGKLTIRLLPFSTTFSFFSFLKKNCRFWAVHSHFAADFMLIGFFPPVIDAASKIL